MAETLYATLHTNHGPIRLQLFPDHAPATVRNFVELAEGTKDYVDPRTGQKGSGPYYDGTISHRVIAGFMIQLGDPTGTGRGGPGFQFADEFHPELQFDRPYLLAMANAGPGTNGSQFFITVSPTPHLNRKSLQARRETDRLEHLVGLQHLGRAVLVGGLTFSPDSMPASEICSTLVPSSTFTPSFL